MAFKLANNVQETTTTTGTGAITLDGAADANSKTFGSQLSNNDTTMYTIWDNSSIECGLGTYLSTGPQLQRDTVYYSTSGGAKINWGSGTRNVVIGVCAEVLNSLLSPDGLTGLLVKTADRTYAKRTLTAGTGIVVTDGDGVSGNPIVSLENTDKSRTLSLNTGLGPAYLLEAPWALVGTYGVSGAIKITNASATNLQYAYQRNSGTFVTGTLTAGGTVNITGLTAYEAVRIQLGLYNTGATARAAGFVSLFMASDSWIHGSAFWNEP